MDNSQSPCSGMEKELTPALPVNGSEDFVPAPSRAKNHKAGFTCSRRLEIRASSLVGGLEGGRRTVERTRSENEHYHTDVTYGARSGVDVSVRDATQ